MDNISFAFEFGFFMILSFKVNDYFCKDKPGKKAKPSHK